MSVRSIAKRLYVRTQRSGYQGRYASWSQARAATTGYDAPTILPRVIDAARRVARGEMAFSQTPRPVDPLSNNWPLLAAFERVALKMRRPVRVVDFGGGLGTVFTRYRAFFDELGVSAWIVVEQPPVVEAGRREFANDTLSFSDDLAAALAGAPDVVLMSSSLQYIEAPADLLRQVRACTTAWLLIDRTPFLTTDGPSEIRVQQVPAWIYDASYPLWVFSRQDVERWIGVAPVWTWKAEDGDGLDYRHLGLLAPPASVE